MKNISFEWTTPALLAGEKTVTRRAWKASYAQSLYVGQQLQAWDKSPRSGGHKVGVIELTRSPYLESTRLAPQEDYFAEGFAYLESEGFEVDGLSPFEVWTRWKREPVDLWVVRFEVKELTPPQPSTLIAIV